MTFPANLKYSKDHTWVSVEGETAKVGITEFAQNELGEIIYVDMPRVAQSFAQGNVFGTVEAVKTTSDLIMPIGGTVKGINSNVVKNPGLVNSDPYKDGWLIEIQINFPQEAKDLLPALEYKTLTGN